MAKDFEGYLVKQRLEDQARREGNIIGATFGDDSKNSVRQLDSIDVRYLMDCVALHKTFNSTVPTAAVARPEWYSAARRDLYDWRKLLKDDIAPETAIYLDCIAREQELKNTAVSAIQRLRTGTDGGKHKK